MKETMEFLPEEIKKIRKRWRHWPYGNLTFLILSLVLFYYLADTAWVKSTIGRIGDLGYIGAFITGVFFVSTFTVVPAALVLYDLAETLDPIYIALLAGAGAVLGDYIIFRFLRDRVFEELLPVLNKLGGSTIKKLFLTPYFAWLIPIAGALIIATPVPDEVGITMLGASKLKNWQFLLLSLLLNSVGILIIVLIARNN